MSASVDRYLVIDLEATCDRQHRLVHEEREIIEIGAVRVHGESLALLDEFQAFVRPVRHPQLTPFCTELTSITQAQVDAAQTFPAVAEALHTWAFREPGELVFCSWGNFDRRQFEQDCAFHEVPYPLPERHLNLKPAFSEAQGVRRHLGMGAAMKRVGLTPQGTLHRGIDDARNIAALLPWCLKR